MHMRMVWLSLVLSSAALAQEPAADPCDAHVERFLALDARFATFEALSIRGGELKLLKQSLKVAARQHQELSLDYARIAAASCGLVSVDAKVMVGRLDEVMAQKLVAIEPPAALQPEQHQGFARELDTKARPLRERAKTTWAVAVRDATRFKLDSELIRLARQRLEDATPPQQHPEHHGEVP